MAGLVPDVQERITSVAVPFAFAGRMFVIGRGAEFATAREIALKLLETCRVAAEPLTATDLAHGPVAALDPLFPVWAIASDDETLPAVLEATARAREAGATVIASGSAAERRRRRGVLASGPDAAVAAPRPRCSRSCRVSCSRGRSRGRRASTPTSRAGSRRSRSRAERRRSRIGDFAAVTQSV